jgi:hypothetical protein
MKTRFYASNIASSSSALCLTVSITGLMIQAGHPLWHVGLLLGAGRMASIAFNFFLGALSDHINPVRALVGIEVAAAMATAPIAMVWGTSSLATTLSIIFFALRCGLYSLSTGPRAKLSKHLSEGNEISHQREAARLNISTHGAALAAGILGVFFVSQGNPIYLILFSTLGPLLSAICLTSLRIKGWDGGPPAARLTKLASPVSFYRIAPGPARRDFLLSLAVMGLGSLNARLSGSSESMIPVMLSLYGLAIWISGSQRVRELVILRSEMASWVSLAATFLALAFLVPVGSPFLLPITFLRDFFYWSIYHRITAETHWATPQSKLALVASARWMQMTFVLGAGELLEGYFAPLLPLELDLIVRALLCTVVALRPSFKTSAETPEAAHA